MKRMCIAAGLALAALGLTQQQVSAWCRFNFSTGINVTYENNGGTFSFLGFSRTTPPPPGMVAAVPAPAVAAPYPAAVPAVAPGGPPAVPAPTPANGTNGSTSNPTATQRTSFYNPPAYPLADYAYSNYSSGAAPSYWYDK